MTEAYEDDWLVRVRAQVMCRDEGTGGWLPLGGGGLSNVMVRKRTRHSSSGQTDTLTLTSSGAVPTSAVNSPPNSTPQAQAGSRGGSGTGAAPPRPPASGGNGRPQNGSPRKSSRPSVGPVLPHHSYHRHTPSDGSADTNNRRTPGVVGSLSRSANPLGNAPKHHQHFKQFGGSGGQLETVGLRTCGSEETNNSSQQQVQPVSAGSGNSGTNSGAGALGLKFEYFIYGKRINDQSVVLSCTIKKDFQYNKVMPTFHHWVTDEKRFGLTFQTAADARAFDKGVRTAIEDLLDGLGGAWPSLHEYKKLNPAPKEDEDDNIFECLNLPSDSRSSSENSTASRSHRRHGNDAPPPLPPLFRLDVKQPPVYNAGGETIGLSASARELLLKKKLSGSCSEEPPMLMGDDTHNSYVQITQMPDYVYPRLGSGMVSLSGDRSPSSHSTAPGSNTTTHSLLQRRDSGSSLKKRAPVSLYSDPPSLMGFRPAHRPLPLPLPLNKRDRDLSKKPLPVSEGFHTRIKCRHCQEWYMESSNKAGSCEYAPDCFKTCINKSSGIQCAQCMLYHCMSDAEGDFAAHPCSCNSAEEGCSRRWLGLTLLSLLVPCLCCYPPLKAVHWCCVGCGVSGGKHMPVQHSYSHH